MSTQKVRLHAYLTPETAAQFDRMQHEVRQQLGRRPGLGQPTWGSAIIEAALLAFDLEAFIASREGEQRKAA